MSLSMAFFTFLNSWWIMLFFVMPFFITAATERVDMEYAAAPRQIRWKKALLINTLAALAITVIFALLIHYDIVPLHDF